MLGANTPPEPTVEEPVEPETEPEQEPESETKPEPWLTRTGLTTTNDYYAIIASSMGDGFGVNENGGLTIAASVQVPQLENALQTFVSVEGEATYKATVLRIGIGMLVNEISARENKDFSQVVSERNLCEATKRSLNTLYEWSKVAREFGQRGVLPGLGISHYIKACLVPIPDDPLAAKEFRKRRNDIMQEASDRSGISSKDVYDACYDEFRALNKDTEQAKTDKREPVSVVMRDYVNTTRLLEACEVDPALFKIKGVTRADLVNHRQECENELIERDVITPDVSSMRLPWVNPVIDVEGEEE